MWEDRLFRTVGNSGWSKNRVGEQEGDGGGRGGEGAGGGRLQLFGV